MSKPNLLSFKVSIGIFGNKRIADVQADLAKAVPEQVPWATHAQTFFEMLMGYAAENQVNGDFNGYTDSDFYKLVFAPKCMAKDIPISIEKTSIIVAAFRERGLLDKNKIRSWLKFNKTLAKHEETVRRNAVAGARSAEARAIKQKDDLDALKGKPKKNGLAEEYGVDQPTKTKGKKSDGRIEWQGTMYFPSELEKVVKSLEVEVEKKAKQCKKAESDLSDAQLNPKRYAAAERAHNIWFSQLLEADKQLASAKSALLRTKIDPPARRKPQPARPAAARRGDPDAAAKAFEDFKRTKEEIAAA